MKTTYLFHINTSYAEIPKSEIKSVCKNSYIPFLKMLDRYELGTILLNLTGLSIEYFSENNREVLNLIKQLLEIDKLRITGCTYSHPILPLLPSDDIRKQIKWHKDLVENHLDTSPVGFFPPELAVDPTLPKYLQEVGYKWIFVDGEALINSKKYPNSHSPTRKQPSRLSSHLIKVDQSKGLRKLIRTFKGFRMLKNHENTIDLTTKRMKTPDSAEGFPVIPAFTALTVGTQLATSKRIRWINPKRQIAVWEKIRQRHEGKKSIMVPYAADLEFFGYMGYLAPGIALDPQSFGEFMLLAADHGYNSHIPDDNDWKAADSIYLKSSSWSVDQNWELWTQDPDNIKLEKICAEIRFKLVFCDDEEIQKRAWKYLLIAENSDGRGWDPLPERKLNCFSAAIRALQLLD